MQCNVLRKVFIWIWREYTCMKIRWLLCLHYVRFHQLLWKKKLRGFLKKKNLVFIGNVSVLMITWGDEALLEGSHKIGYVCPSFRASVSFLGNGSLVFSENQDGVRGPYIVVCDRARFFWKKSPSGKND